MWGFMEGRPFVIGPVGPRRLGLHQEGDVLGRIEGAAHRAPLMSSTNISVDSLLVRTPTEACQG
ncbi:hypothetical protein EAO79_00290 [Plantibacter sp. PA-3-X8]|nr:hypothetical protein EAO79_00290 [Plantibacter sp. PA-3-X8]